MATDPNAQWLGMTFRRSRITWPLLGEKNQQNTRMRPVVGRVVRRPYLDSEEMTTWYILKNTKVNYNRST